MIQQWHEFTCSYLWNGMLIGRTRRLKHHRNGGKRSQRWGNIYAAWPAWPLLTPPRQSIKKHVFVYTKCSNSEGCVCIRNGPKGRSLSGWRWVGVMFNCVLCLATWVRMPWSQLCVASAGKCPPGSVVELIIPFCDIYKQKRTDLLFHARWLQIDKFFILQSETKSHNCSSTRTCITHRLMTPVSLVWWRPRHTAVFMSYNCCLLWRRSCRSELCKVQRDVELPLMNIFIIHEPADYSS